MKYVLCMELGYGTEERRERERERKTCNSSFSLAYTKKKTNNDIK
jgi:hypothetical protein